jgi:hypothetical protein
MKSNLRAVEPLLALGLAAAFFLNDAEAAVVFPVGTNADVVEACVGISFDGTNYLFGLVSGTNVCAQLVSATGALIGSLINVGNNPGSRVPEAAIIFGHTNYLLAWSDNSISSGVNLFGQLISRSGAKFGPAFPLLQSLGTHGFQAVQALAFDGTNFRVVWQDTNNSFFYGQFVTADGTLSGSEFLISSQQNNRSAAAIFGAMNYLVVWQSNNGSQPDINQTYGALVSRNGSVSTLFQISQTSTPSYNPLTDAFDGTNYLVVWNQDVGQGNSNPKIWNLYGRLVSPGGTTIGNELVLATNQALIPSLAFDGSNYLLAWSYNLNTTNLDKTMRYQFFDRSGSEMGPDFTVFSAQGTNQPLFALNGLVFDGTRFALASMLGVLNVDANGRVGGYSRGDVYGTFLPKSTASPRLDVAGPVTAARFPLQLTGTPGVNYAIQTKTDLSALNWMSLVTNSPASGTFTFTDTTATNRSRFYRAVRQ